MQTNLKLGLALVAALTLTACGGGSNPTPRGAIAIDVNSGRGSISVSHTSQPMANSTAIRECGLSSCVVVTEFSGDGQCGSAATSLNGVWGVGLGNTHQQADSKAIEQCANRGGNTCVIPTWVRERCN